MAIYWTLQTKKVWEYAKQQGYLVGNQDYAMFPEAYIWMIEQMKKRLPNYQGEYPVWLWIEKPDMRQAGHFRGGTKCVRLKVELDDQNVLISDFDDWHMVLNDDFFADSEEEYDYFHAGKLSITKEESWQRIFEWDRKRDPNWDGDKKRKLQGTTGKIELSNVISVEHFIARKSRVEN
jgi:hypothetical protein